MSTRAEEKAKRGLAKEIDKRIKEQAKNFGYKFRNPCAFAKRGEYFISSFCIVVSLEKAIIDIDVKKLVYDDIFWDVMNMSSNKDQPLSLRAVGAFTAPAIGVCRKEIPIASDLDLFIRDFYKTVSEESEEFLQKNPLDDYILSNTTHPYASTLKCLVYLSRNDPASAVCEAKQAIASGDHRGGFENERKGFFDWILFRFDGQEDVSSPPVFPQTYQSVPIENAEEKTFVNVEMKQEKMSFIEKIKALATSKKQK